MNLPLNHIAPTRYYSKTVEMGFFEALGRFIKYREWSWTRTEFEAVYKGDPRYEGAPFEEHIFQMTVGSYNLNTKEWEKVVKEES